MMTAAGCPLTRLSLKTPLRGKKGGRQVSSPAGASQRKKKKSSDLGKTEKKKGTKRNNKNKGCRRAVTSLLFRPLERKKKREGGKDKPKIAKTQRQDETSSELKARGEGIFSVGLPET